MTGLPVGEWGQNGGRQTNATLWECQYQALYKEIPMHGIFAITVAHRATPDAAPTQRGPSNGVYFAN